MNDVLFDKEHVVDIVNNYINTTKIMTLVFSNGNIMYIEKDILSKCDYFCNMMAVNDNNSIPLHGIVDDEKNMHVLINYLKFNKINNSKHYDLNELIKTIELFDCVCCDLKALLQFFVDHIDYTKNITFENINKICHFMKLLQIYVSMITIYKDNNKYWISVYGVDAVLSSLFFKNGILPYNYSTEVVLEHRYYPLYFDIAQSYNYIRILNDLLENKPDGWWFIVDKIYRQFYGKTSREWMHTNMHRFDITFFDVDTTYYDNITVAYMKNKFNKY